MKKLFGLVCFYLEFFSLFLCLWPIKQVLMFLTLISLSSHVVGSKKKILYHVTISCYQFLGEKTQLSRFFLQVYATSVAMLLTAVVSIFLFGFHPSLAFFLGSMWVVFFNWSIEAASMQLWMRYSLTKIIVFCSIVSISVYLHSIGKVQR